MSAGSLVQTFSLPSSTPAERPYTTLINSTQFARNNFQPRKREWRRTISPQETTVALRWNLQKYWGYSDFRHPQEQVCENAMRGCNMIVVAPTGLGKSICFQLPATTIEHGVTIVVSPLVSLMEDQLRGLHKKGIRAEMLGEKITDAKLAEIRKEMRLGHPKIRLLYVTPESLLSPRHKAMFDKTYEQRQMARLVVDEVSLATSEWGLDFRPRYREIGDFLQRYRGLPVTALTASATQEVRNDIIKSLNIQPGYGQWVMPFNRRNLYYEVRYQGRGSEEDVEQDEEKKSTVEEIADFIEQYKPQAKARNVANGILRPCVTGIVYCRTTKDCENVSAYLGDRGIKSRPYYKARGNEANRITLEAWNDGMVECIVATIAFGMGIDQPHVRYVIHYDMPKSFEGYYQETGRAGRDGHNSHCILFYSREDAKKVRWHHEMNQQKKRKHGAEEDPENAMSPVNSFKSLQHFLEATGKCRHVGICQYFGEKIDVSSQRSQLEYCEGMCDVCTSGNTVANRALQLSEGVDIASQPDIRPVEEIVPLPPSPEPLDAISEEGSFTGSFDGFDLNGDEEYAFSEDEDTGPAPKPLFPSLAIAENPLSPLPAPPSEPPTTMRGKSTPPSTTRTPIVAATSSHASSPHTLHGSSITLPSAASTSSGGANIPVSMTPKLQRDISSEALLPASERVLQPIRRRDISQYTPTRPSLTVTSGPGPSTVNAARAAERQEQKRRREASSPKREFITPIRGVTYLDNSEEGTGSELKLNKEQRMKAERLLNSVDPVRGSGPYECYNNTPTSNKIRKISSARNTFKPPLHEAPRKVRCDLIQKPFREKGVNEMIDALKVGLAKGDLAKKVLRHWGRREHSLQRMKMLHDVAALLEHERRIAEFKSATKFFRSPDLVQILIHDAFAEFDDMRERPEVGHLRALEKCMREYRAAEW
ncbi:hypothetical protein I317_06323 [Kwoniella heveanensis CBS 569]|nr:hypothetical protein I317_06323 [Kwoniella heveanensis CBS 569]